MTKKLYRSQNDKIIAGVCGGLADYFDIDPTIIRLLFILVVAFGGSGLLIYLILWLIMPRETEGSAVINEQRIHEFAQEIKEKAHDLKEEFKKEKEKSVDHHKEKNKRRSSLFGWILIILGAVFLANNFMPHWMTAHIFSYWPFLLVFIGIMMVVGINKK